MILDKYTKIYEKKNAISGYKELWAESGVAGTSDTQLTYKANDGSEITDATLNTSYKFFYEKLKNIFGNDTPNQTVPSGRPTDNDTQINVFIGTEKLFGSDFFTVTVANDSEGTLVLKIGSTTITSGTSVAEGQKVDGTITNTSEKVTDKVTLTVGTADPVELTVTNNEFSFTVSGNSTIKVTEKDA